jgi:hypothetical protein
MLEKISWGDYFTAIICVAFLYYVAVILLYYRSELQSFLQRSATKPGTGQTDNDTAGTVKDQAFSGLEDNTITDLRGILEKAGKGASKDELLERLNQRLAGYAGLRHPAFRTAIKNYIKAHALDLCGLDISGDELESTWAKLSQ